MIELFKEIPFQLEPAVIMKSLRLRIPKPRIANKVEELVRVIKPLARPKAIYKASYIDNKATDSLDIDGVRFNSRILRDNLDSVNRVFPYIVTCGREVEDYDAGKDMVGGLCLEAIKLFLVGAAANFLLDRITKKYVPGQLSHMNPGSLNDWPLTQQQPLFSLFGSAEAEIGVRLSEGNIIHPLKSISGIYFPTEVKFESCQLCPRRKCIGRRAAYSPELAGKYGK